MFCCEGGRVGEVAYVAVLARAEAAAHAAGRDAVVGVAEDLAGVAGGAAAAAAAARACFALVVAGAGVARVAVAAAGAADAPRGHAAGIADDLAYVAGADAAAGFARLFVCCQYGYGSLVVVRVGERTGQHPLVVMQ